MEDLELKKRFDAAANFMRGVMAKPNLDNETLLYFYARFKQANEGPCNADKPSFFTMPAAR